MLIVISPAKTLDFETESVINKHTQPALLDESSVLIKQLKQYTPAEISALMKISDKLGTLNFTRFNDWKRPFTKNNAKQALLAFKGDVYTGLEAESFTEAEFDFAQKHLRILSGLYGILKPLDLIQPYRLEMGTHLKNKRGDDLYDYWGDKITKSINSELKKIKNPYLINLASNEYFKSIQTDNLNAEIITPVFKDFKNGQYKIVSFFAKKARGMMSAYIIKNQLSDIDDIKSFKQSGYKFSKTASDDTTWVFQRKQS